MKPKTDKGYVAEGRTDKTASKKTKDEKTDLSNFNKLKKLLKPFENNLNLLEGVKLADVEPTYDSES